MGWYQRGGKRALDLVVCVGGGILVLPVVGVIAVLVRWKMGSPVLFRQQRPGLGGELFNIVKFRTMGQGRDPRGELLPDSERLTRLGRALRQSSLDEIPEIWNVLRGDMSLVGPRPLLPSYLDYYSVEEMTRHSVRPGITGLAQVSGRNLLEWDDRLRLDVQYVESYSFLGDLRILLLTVKKVFLQNDLVVATSSETDLDKMRDGRLSANTYPRPSGVATRSESVDGLGAARDCPTLPTGSFDGRVDP